MPALLLLLYSCELGLCYLRVPTWAPFRLQFYCNGHNLLASALNKKNIDFQMLDNVFVHIDDFDKAQNFLMTSMLNGFIDNWKKSSGTTVRLFDTLSIAITGALCRSNMRRTSSSSKKTTLN